MALIGMASQQRWLLWSDTAYESRVAFGSTSDSTVSDLTAAKLTPKLRRRTAARRQGHVRCHPRVRPPGAGLPELAPRRMRPRQAGGVLCKRRGGLCPSCGARRMSLRATHLVDRVSPIAADDDARWRDSASGPTPPPPGDSLDMDALQLVDQRDDATAHEPLGVVGHRRVAGQARRRAVGVTPDRHIT